MPRGTGVQLERELLHWLLLWIPCGIHVEVERGRSNDVPIGCVRVVIQECAHDDI